MTMLAKTAVVPFLTGMSLAVAALVLVQWQGSARAASEPYNVGINAAAPVPPAVAATKGDLLNETCGGETWPQISAECLAAPEGETAHEVRYVTYGYQADTNTTVLIRFPSADAATR